MELMDGDKFSIVDLSALSEPVCKLIEAVTQCIGTLYEPTRIRRKAKAEADAALILAEADAEKQALLKRAAHRLAIKEINRQKNIENIINQAVNSLPETVSSDPVDPDWISRFFDECKDVSNEDLQKIWARLLANEVAIPKSCSRKTLTVLKDLSSNDAKIFKTLCSLLWSKHDAYFIPYEYGFNLDSQLNKYDLSYSQCLHFDNLGLIHSKMDLMLNINSGEKLDYFDRNHICYVQPSNMQAEISCFPLTRPGIELIIAAHPEFNSDFYIDCLKLFSNNYSVFLACPI
jgi:hypothetical protein